MRVDRREFGVRALFALGKVGVWGAFVLSGPTHAQGTPLVNNDPDSMKNTADRLMTVPRRVLDSLQFESASAALKSSAAPGVAAIAKQWRESSRNTVVALTVRAEPAAPPAQGLVLAEARAQILVQALVASGIPPAAVRARGIAAVSTAPRLPANPAR